MVYMDTYLQGDDANLASACYACFMGMCVHALPSGVDVSLCAHCGSDVNVEAVCVYVCVCMCVWCMCVYVCVVCVCLSVCLCVCAVCVCVRTRVCAPW